MRAKWHGAKGNRGETTRIPIYSESDIVWTEGAYMLKKYCIYTKYEPLLDLRNDVSVFCDASFYFVFRRL